MDQNKYFASLKANLSLMVEVEIIQDLKMINTQLKFEAEIPNGSKVVAFTRNYKANLTV